MLARSFGGSPSGRGGRIPLARVGGTLDDPKVVVTADVALRFASAYGLGGKTLGTVGRTLDQILGTEAPKGVLDVLEGVLGAPPERK